MNEKEKIGDIDFVGIDWEMNISVFRMAHLVLVNKNDKGYHIKVQLL